jgi:hypothetical protein
MQQTFERSFNILRPTGFKVFGGIAQDLHAASRAAAEKDRATARNFKPST